MQLSRRLGKVVIQDDLLLDEDNWEIVQQSMLIELIPIRVEYLLAEKIFEYTAYSKQFREIDASELVPYYIGSVDHNGKCIFKEEKGL